MKHFPLVHGVSFFPCQGSLKTPILTSLGYRTIIGVKAVLSSEILFSRFHLRIRLGSCGQNFHFSLSLFIISSPSNSTIEPFLPRCFQRNFFSPESYLGPNFPSLCRLIKNMIDEIKNSKQTWNVLLSLVDKNQCMCKDSGSNLSSDMDIAAFWHRAILWSHRGFETPLLMGLFPVPTFEAKWFCHTIQFERSIRIVHVIPWVLGTKLTRKMRT